MGGGQHDDCGRVLARSPLVLPLVNPVIPRALALASQLRQALPFPCR